MDTYEDRGCTMRGFKLGGECPGRALTSDWLPARRRGRRAQRACSRVHGNSVALRARSRTPAVVPTYISRVVRTLAWPAMQDTSVASSFHLNRAVVQNTCRRLCQVQGRRGSWRGTGHWLRQAPRQGRAGRPHRVVVRGTRTARIPGCGPLYESAAIPRQQARRPRPGSWRPCGTTPPPVVRIPVRAAAAWGPVPSRTGLRPGVAAWRAPGVRTPVPPGNRCPGGRRNAGGR
jgi:hypothetical protein